MYIIEDMKLFPDKLMAEAGVQTQLHNGKIIRIECPEDVR